MVRRLAGSSETPPGFRHRTSHFRVLSSSARHFTFGTLGSAILSIALALFGRILSFICAQLAIVGRLLTLAGDPVPLIGNPISLVGGPLAAVELVLPPHERELVLVDLTLGVRGVVGNHPFIKRLVGVGATIAARRGHVAGKYGEISPRFCGRDPRGSDDDAKFAIHAHEATRRGLRHGRPAVRWLGMD
jgi:hypothetical protein